MKLTHLQYFLAVAEDCNISRAAQKLFISQQSLSEQINRLEQDYKVKLFERTPRLRLTEAGERMVNYAEKMLSLDSQCRKEMENLSKGESLTLKLGIRTPYINLVVPRILPLYLESHPHVKPRIMAAESRDLAKALKAGELDIAIASPRLFIDPAFVLDFLPSDPFMLVIPENLLECFGLTPETAALGMKPDLKGLETASFVLLRDTTRLTRVAADYFLNRNGVLHPNIIMECYRNEAALLACSTGLGATFAQKRIFQNYADNPQAMYRMYGFEFDTPSIETRAIIAYNRNTNLGKEVSDFISLVKKRI